MKRTRNWTAGVMVIALAAFTANVTTVSASSLPAKDSKKWVAPAEAKKLKNPLPASKEIINLGKQTYQLQCATCHGTLGKGDGMAGKFLPVKPANFLLPEFQKQTDGEIFWKITHGKSPMPAFKDLLTEEQRWQLVHYLRTFKKSK